MRFIFSFPNPNQATKKSKKSKKVAKIWVKLWEAINEDIKDKNQHNAEIQYKVAVHDPCAATGETEIGMNMYVNIDSRHSAIKGKWITEWQTEAEARALLQRMVDGDDLTSLPADTQPPE